MYSLAALLMLVGLTTGSVAQSFDTEFGKNRVQYSDDFKYWNVYETENFLTYFYGKSRNVAIPTLQMAELYHDDIQAILEHKTNQKIQIIVYSDLADLKQSNVGLSESFINTTGETKIVGNRMFVYFDGNHQHLQRQVKEGIATVYLNSMLFGSTLQEIVQNAVSLNLPEWYKQGIVRYCARPWNYLLDDELRDILHQDPYRYSDFEKLSDDYPRIAGHSMWYLIDRNYGRSAIANLLYLTKITRNMESSFLYVLGVSYETVQEEWEAYYRDYYSSEAEQFTSSAGHIDLNLRHREYVPPSQLKLSPNGNQLAYAVNDIGRIKVYIRDLRTEEEQRIWKYGYRNKLQATDYNYPVITWHPRAPVVSLFYQDKDVIYLRRTNLGKDETETQVIPGSLNRIYGALSLDDDSFILNADGDGYSDLYLYDARTRAITNITQDYYDDLDISRGTYQGKSGFFWASNRGDDFRSTAVDIDTLLPVENRDIYFYDLAGGDIIRLTQTPQLDERQPTLAKTGVLTYLHAGSGVRNIYAHNLADETTRPITNLDRNIILHTTNMAMDEHLAMYYYDGGYRTYSLRLDYGEKVPVNTTPYATKKKEQPIILIEPDEEQDEETDVIKPGYLFQSPFDDPTELEPIELPSTEQEDPLLQLPGLESAEEKETSIHQFNPARIVASRLRFRLDNFTTKFDNQALFEGLESSIGDPNQLNVNPAGILIKGSVRDLFEDHIIEAGVRFPTTFDGSEYFLTYDDNKRLIDRRYALYRRAYTESIDDTTLPATRSRKTTWLGLYRIKYPFDVYKSVRLTGTFRQDRFHQQSTDLSSLEFPVERQSRIGLKAEYVFDNTIDVSLNIMHGTRYKFYLEAANRFGLDVVDGFDFDASLGFTSIIGFDVRHYIPLLRHSVIALRATGASSFGSEKMLYYIGGVNNWIFQQFDENIPQPSADEFAFRTLAPHLRGFRYNIRNGSTFGLINAEARIPVMKYLFRRPISNAFFRNLQLVLFYDAGMAWHGVSPTGPENPINSITISRPPAVEVDVQYFRDPLVMGVGGGLRSTLLGYFIKLDYAWGIETRVVQEPRIYFSIGTDF